MKYFIVRRDQFLPAEGKYWVDNLSQAKQFNSEADAIEAESQNPGSGIVEYRDEEVIYDSYRIV